MVISVSDFVLDTFSDKLCSTFTAILLSLNWALTPSSPTLLTRLLTNTRRLRRYDTLIIFLLSQFNVLTYSPNVNFLLVYLIVWWLLIHSYFFWHHNYPIKSFDSLACCLWLIEPQTSSDHSFLILHLISNFGLTQKLGCTSRYLIGVIFWKLVIMILSDQIGCKETWYFWAF